MIGYSDPVWKHDPFPYYAHFNTATVQGAYSLNNFKTNAEMKCKRTEAGTRQNRYGILGQQHTDINIRTNLTDKRLRLIDCLIASSDGFSGVQSIILQGLLWGTGGEFQGSKERLIS